MKTRPTDFKSLVAIMRQRGDIVNPEENVNHNLSMNWCQGISRAHAKRRDIERQEAKHDKNKEQSSSKTS